MLNAFRDTLRKLDMRRHRPSDRESSDDRVFQARGKWYVQVFTSTVLGPYRSVADAEALAVLVDRQNSADRTASPPPPSRRAR